MVLASNPRTNFYADTISIGLFDRSSTPASVIPPSKDCITARKADLFTIVGSGCHKPLLLRQCNCPERQSGRGQHFCNHGNPNTSSNDKSRTYADICPRQGPTCNTPDVAPSLLITVPFANRTITRCAGSTFHPSLVQSSLAIKLNVAPLSTSPKTEPAKLDDKGSV